MATQKVVTLSERYINPGDWCSGGGAEGKEKGTRVTREPGTEVAHSRFRRLARALAATDAILGPVLLLIYTNTLVGIHIYIYTRRERGVSEGLYLSASYNTMVLAQVT